MNAMDSINNPFTPGVNYGDMRCSANSLSLWTESYGVTSTFAGYCLFGGLKKNETKHFL